MPRRGTPESRLSPCASDTLPSSARDQRQPGIVPADDARADTRTVLVDLSSKWPPDYPGTAAIRQEKGIRAIQAARNPWITFSPAM